MFGPLGLWDGDAPPSSPLIDDLLAEVKVFSVSSLGSRSRKTIPCTDDQFFKR